MNKKLDILAPVKINLSLAVTGRLDNGYHLLDSLVAFADIGDRVTMEPGTGFSFHVTGPFARDFAPADLDNSRASGNLAVKAAYGMAEAAGRPLACKITLHKNVPLASGIGGGSADAAAVIWGLMELWGLTPPALPWLHALALSLGSDVPVCLACRPVRMMGTGERLEPVQDLPELPVLLVNPGMACPTPDVFGRFGGPYATPSVFTSGLDRTALLSWLEGHGNGLTEAAVTLVPEIAFVLADLKSYDGCMLSRMSGSGATCFGLFESEEDASAAANALTEKHPDWWVKAGMLNRVERY
jgi:4-diphosphocytidyl-2-C-methyl-D-erythritol kinase